MDENGPVLGPNVLFVEDVERSKRFYCDVLGFTVSFEDDNSAGISMGDDLTMLLNGEAAQDLLTGHSTGTPRGRAPMSVFNLFVDDVDAWFSRISAAGVEFILEPTDRVWGRRTAHFADPDGFVWEISQSIN